MEPLKLKNNLAKGIKKSLEDIKTFKTGIQDDLDHQIANICYKTLRYINKIYGQDIYSDTAITDNNISNIQKLLIYIFIIFYFHSANNDLRDTQLSEPNWKSTFKIKISNLHDLWFMQNKFAQVPSTSIISPAINRPTEYKPFKRNHNINRTQYQENIRKIFMYTANNFLDGKLVNIIANSVYNIAKNNYNILTALLSDPYYISYNFEVGLNHPNVPNHIIKASNFVRGDYGFPLDIQPANFILIGGVDINLATGGTHYLIHNIVFDNNTNLPVVTDGDNKYVKVFDFIPVKKNGNQINNLANTELIADISANTAQAKENVLNPTDQIGKYFNKIVKNDDNEYKLEFNTNGRINDVNSLKFELYVIKES